MILFFLKSKNKYPQYNKNDELPDIAVLIAAYNEETVIEKKIESVFFSDYPISKIKLYIGSDASTDQTNKIIDKIAQKYNNIKFIKFTSRVGKISIINHLHSLCDQSILILTDANVMFDKSTIFELVKMFKYENVGLVAANIIKESISYKGISLQEKKYLSFENKIKACESNAFNLIMGAEGGCYAIRNEYLSMVPSNFIVDDFFITMKVIIRKKKALFNLNAICKEDIPPEIIGEYKRKVRISSGNFQNLFFFKKLLILFFKPVCFTFWSHKVFRWLTPFFLILIFFTSGILSFFIPNFIFIFFIQLLGLLSPLLNYFYKFNSTILKFIIHFYLMNLALFEGFIKFIIGIKTSIWQPIKRNV